MKNYIINLSKCFFTSYNIYLPKIRAFNFLLHKIQKSFLIMIILFVTAFYSASCKTCKCPAYSNVEISGDDLENKV
jgi:hypothetical protein